jgi:FkbM family methyltransferase
MNHPLNSENKLQSIIGFIKWQIGSRLVPGAIVYDWVNGSRFFVNTGETGITGNIYTGLHDFSDMAFLIHVLRREDLFVDVGANVGSYTILACSAVGSRGYAFEPIPSTYRKLIENMRLNHLDTKVQCINKGVGGMPGYIAFTSESGPMNHALTYEEECFDTINVEVISLDMALGDDLPALLKIDVEGYETPVLEGAEKTLKNETLHSVIMELNGNGSRYGFDESRILECMFDYGFRTYSYNPLDRSLVNLEGKKTDAGNTLFIRNMSLVTERLKSSPMVSVRGRQF